MEWSSQEDKETGVQLDAEKITPQDITEPLYPETDLDRGIVGWDSQDDPRNPQNFSAKKKWTLLLFLSAFTFISPLASSMFAPAVGFMAKDFNETNETILSLSVSIFLIGYTIGPLLLAPLSEIYGRRIVLSGANWFFVVWQIGCALAQNIETLIVCRLFAGIGGSGCITLGAGVIADMFPIKQRGAATSIWTMGPLIGPVVGPIAGGFLSEGVNWRWVFWLLLIVGGAVQAAIEIFNKETYAPVLIKKKTAKMAKQLGRTDLQSAYEYGHDVGTPGQLLRRSLSRPILLLCKSPIVLLLAIYIALIYGLLYLFFTTIPDVFTSTYGFSVGLSGLAYLGIGLGFLGGLTLMGLTNDRVVGKLTARNGGKFEPEMRLPTMIIFSAILPISFFWYGWTADKHVFWIVPIIGMFPFGFGMMGVYMPTQTYVIDCYPNSPSTRGASNVSDSWTGMGKFAARICCSCFVPIPIIFNKYGKTIRERWYLDFDKKKSENE
ncbi:hypothetical protein N7470_000892 [Penicillium chermesinum]|nr:hypothetical protein N7470_000892 [Penicillium chermesinum]